MAKKTITLVIPVHNEEAALPAFFDRIDVVLGQLASDKTYQFNLLFVNDGSLDATEFLITKAVPKHAKVQLINLSRNFGKENALFAGLTAAKGDAVIPIDVDLQDPPEAISDMLTKWKAGSQIVNAKRISRTEDAWIKRVTASLFYRIFNLFAERRIPENVGDFRLLDRQVVDSVLQVGDKMRFNKEVFSWVGFSSDEVEIERAPRSGGESKWSLWSLWNLALDGLFSSSTVPLRIWSYLGFLFSVFAFVYLLFIVISTLLFGRDLPGYSSTIVTILFFGGLNLLSLGILGEYIGRIYTEVRQRPSYIIRSSFGLEDEE